MHVPHYIRTLYTMLRLTFVTSSYIHTATDAKCWFVKLWSSLELFGMEFFSSTNVDTKDNGLVGVSKYRVRRRWCGGRSRRGRKQRGRGERGREGGSCSIFKGILSTQVMFLFHKKKKNLCWDIDTLVQWKHVSIRYKITRL